MAQQGEYRDPLEGAGAAPAVAEPPSAYQDPLGGAPRAAGGYEDPLATGYVDTKGIFDRIGETIKRPQRLIGFVAGADEVAEFAQLWQSGERMRKGEDTADDWARVHGFFEHAKSDKSMGYNVANILLEMVPIVQEFALTGGLGTIIRKGGSKVGGKALKEFLEVGLEKATERTLARTLAEMGVATVAQTALSETIPRIAGAEGGRITANQYRRNLQDAFNVTEDEAGQLAISFHGSASGFAKEWTPAVLDTLIENLSERVFNVAPALKRMFPNAKLPAVPVISALQSRVGSWWLGKNPDKGVGGVLRKIGKAGGWHGPIKEFMEERIGGGMRAITPGLEEEGMDQLFPDLDQIATELIAFTIPGATRATAQALIEGPPDARPELPGTVHPVSGDAADAGQPAVPGVPEDRRQEVQGAGPTEGGADPVQAEQGEAQEPQEAARGAPERATDEEAEGLAARHGVEASQGEVERIDLYSKSSEELSDLAVERRGADRAFLDKALGEKKAGRLLQLGRAENSSDPKRAESASRQLEALEASLSPAEKRALDLYEQGATGELDEGDIRDVAKQVSAFEGARTAEDFAFEFQYLLPKLPTGDAPGKWSREERSAIALMQRARAEAEEKGLDLRDITERTKVLLAGRYGGDFEEMVGRFFLESPREVTPKQLAAPKATTEDAGEFAERYGLAHAPGEIESKVPDAEQLTREEFIEKVHVTPPEEAVGSQDLFELHRGALREQTGEPGISDEPVYAGDIYEPGKVAIVARDDAGEPQGIILIEDVEGQDPSAETAMAPGAPPGLAAKLVEYAESRGVDVPAIASHGGFTTAGARAMHRGAVERALREGREVPEKVLAQYKGVQKRLAREKAATPEATAPSPSTKPGQPEAADPVAAVTGDVPPGKPPGRVPVPEDMPDPKSGDAHAEIVDGWISEEDVAVQEAASDAMRKRRRLREVRKGKRRKETQAGVKESNESIHLHIDLKGIAAEEMAQYGEELTDEQRAAVERSQNLTPEEQALADEIIAENKASGEELKDAEIIETVRENYNARLWRDETPGKGEPKMPKFSTTTGRFKARSLTSIVHGWALGKELAVPGAIEAQQLGREQTARAIAARNLIKSGTKAGLFKDKQVDGYEAIEHPNFRSRVHRGKALPGEVYGRDNYVDEDGNLFQRVPLYAPAAMARDLNKILGKSQLGGVPGTTGAKVVDVATKYNAHAKSWLFFYGWFHHAAFLRSYYLGTPMKSGAPLGLRRAMREGQRAIENFTPEVRDLVAQGLTLSHTTDFEKYQQEQETIVGKILDRVVPAAAPARKAIMEMRDRHSSFLFEHLGPTLKVQAALAEYSHLLKKHQAKIISGEATREQYAKIAAEMANADFGGLHLRRKRRDPTHQHIYRLLALAPDWTESNVLAFTESFRKGDKGKAYRDMWGRILVRGFLPTIAFNAVIASLLDDEDETFAIRMRKAIKMHTPWTAVDLTGVAPDEEGRRKYFSLVGHFADPVKWVTDFVGAAKGKQSLLGSLVFEAMDGENWRGQRFTSLSELLGAEDKPGELTRYTRKRYGSVKPEEYPSYLLAQARGVLPIPAQESMSFLAGEIDWFTALTRGLGLHTMSRKDPDD